MPERPLVSVSARSPHGRRSTNSRDQSDQTSAEQWNRASETMPRMYFETHMMSHEIGEKCQRPQKARKSCSKDEFGLLSSLNNSNKLEKQSKDTKQRRKSSNTPGVHEAC